MEAYRSEPANRGGPKRLYADTAGVRIAGFIHYASVEKRVGSRPSRRVAVTYSLPLDGGGVGVADRHAAKTRIPCYFTTMLTLPHAPSRQGRGDSFFPCRAFFTHLKFNRA